MTTRQFRERSALRIFLSHFYPHRKLFILDRTGPVTPDRPGVPAVSRWCLYELLPQNAYGAFFAVMAVVFAALALRALMQYVICYWGHTFGILVEADIRRDLFHHMQELSLDYYDRNRTGHHEQAHGGPVRYHGAWPTTARRMCSSPASPSWAPCASCSPSSGGWHW